MTMTPEAGSARTPQPGYRVAVPGRDDNAASSGQIGGILGGICGLAVGWQRYHGVVDIDSRISRIGFSALLLGGLGGLLGVLLGFFRDRAARNQPRSPHVDAAIISVWAEWLRLYTLGSARRQLAYLARGQGLHDAIARMAETKSRPRILAQGAPMSTILETWRQDPFRLVILGEPGYGKSVAALEFVRSLNGHKDASSRIAVFAPLAEWYRWQASTADKRIDAWIASYLAEGLGPNGVPKDVATALAESGLIVPILDGFDEVPRGHRAACKDAIDQFAGYGAATRPFVVTSRVAEYVDLAPDWVLSDRQYVLPGLSREEIVGIISAEAERRPEWGAILDHLRLVKDDDPLIRLFSSPLRCSLALRRLGSVSPAVLLNSSLKDSKALLWESLLNASGSAFRDVDMAQSRRWLAFIAEGLSRRGVQRFWPHDLYTYAHAPRRDQIAFVSAIGLAGAILLAVPFGVSFGLIPGGISGVAGAMLSGCRRNFAPVTRTASSLRQRLWNERYFALKLSLGLSGAAVPLLIGLWLVRGEPFSLAWNVWILIGCILIGVGTAALNASDTGRATILSEFPPELVSEPRPNTVLRGSALNGWKAAAGIFLLCTATGGPIFYASQTSVITLLFTAMWGVLFAGSKWLDWGLAGWAYHYWVRWNLSRRNLLPFRLFAFLDWCCEVGWLRVGEAYEFRHRELLEYIAPQETTGSA